MSDTDKKKLSELRVVDLRSELEKRGLERSGIKQVLSDRLAKALVDEGENPETYLFDISEKKTVTSEKVEDKEPEKMEDEVSVKDEPADELANDADKLDLDAATEGHESPIRLTLEDDEALQDVENESSDKTEKEALDDNKKNDDDTSEEAAATGSTTTNIQKAESNHQTDETSTMTATTTQTAADVKKEEKDSSENGSPSTKNSSGSDNKLQKKVAKSNPNVLWISNVAQNTRASELKSTLSTCGKVLGAKVVVNARFPGSCCFGYVTMASVEDVENVIAKLNNTELNGQIIKIDKFDLVRAEQMKQMTSSGKDHKASKDGGDKKSDEKKDSNKTTESKGENGKSEHKDRARSRDRRHSGSRRVGSERTKSASSKGGDRPKSASASKDRLPNRSRSRSRRERDVLTFDKIRTERERQRLREKERQLREEARRRQEEDIRRRETERRQRMERERLEREKEKLRLEREKIERERAELVRMERERQRLEREKIAMEKMELENTLRRLGEERMAVKRPAPSYRRDDAYEDRKRSASDRHFEPPPPPSSSKREAHYPEKRGGATSYESSARSSGISSRQNSASLSSSRPYDSRESSRGSNRDIPSSSRSKDARYERDRSPHHYRTSSRDERRGGVVPESKPSIPISERLGRYESSESSSRYDRNMKHTWQGPPQSSFSGSGGGGGGSSLSQKSWQKDQWRQEPIITDRWQSSQSSNRIFPGVNSSGPICPPPPGLNNYPDSRFNSSIRKY